MGLAQAGEMLGNVAFYASLHWVFYWGDGVYIFLMETLLKVSCCYKGLCLCSDALSH